MAPNPYAPPENTPMPSAEVVGANDWPSLRVEVSQVVNRWSSQSMTLGGDLIGLLRYETIGFGERVYWNDQLVARTPLISRNASIFNAVAGTVTFTLPHGNAAIPARLDVYVSIPRLLVIVEFRLTICDQVVYEQSNHH